MNTGYNVNKYDTDFIKLDGLIIDANALEAVKKVKDKSGENDLYCIFYFKNGHSMFGYMEDYERLEAYCR